MTTQEEHFATFKASVDTFNLHESGEALLEAMDDFVRALHRAGGRDSADSNIRHFCAYHLADLEGNDNGGSWLASNLLADEVRKLVNEPADEDGPDCDGFNGGNAWGACTNCGLTLEEHEPDGPVQTSVDRPRCESGWTGDRCTFDLFHDGPHSNDSLGTSDDPERNDR
jgi:hypothetical protein